jgi:cytochrome c biogenesis protein CcdA
MRVSSKFRVLSVLLIFVLLLFSSTTVLAAAAARELTLVYFYSATCESCQEMAGFLNGLEEKHKNIILKKYDITDLSLRSLMDKYNTAYKVSGRDEGIVPVVFVRDKYFSREENIKANLEEEIIKTSDIPTIEINDMEESHQKDIVNFMDFKIFGVLLAGLLNGLNPCSLSMLLFFASLLSVEKVKILKTGISFCCGKFLAFLLLGTVFFTMLSKLDATWIHVVIKSILAAFIILLIVLNAKDYFAAKNEKYSAIKLQLPNTLRKFNYRMIKRIAAVSDFRMIILLSFVLGIIISFGEFLCTGQIYLATIVTVLQTNSSLNGTAFLYLVIYSLGFILPLVAMIFVIYKGREVFELSEAIREKLHLIKLLNILMFILIGIMLFLL